MKKIIFFLFTITAMSLLTMAAAAQKPKARDLYIEKETGADKGKSGARVRILLKRGTEKERYVAPTETFYSGDKIKLAFDINFSGYVALLNVGSSGRVTLLYPYPGASAKIEPNDKEQFIPANEKDWIKFDEQAGTEQITIVFSANPIKTIEEIVEKSKTENSGTTETKTVKADGTTGANVNVSGNNNTVNVTVTANAQASLQELNDRSLKRSKSRDLYIETVKDDATYAVGESSLIGAPTAFVISLKHAPKK